MIINYQRWSIVIHKNYHWIREKIGIYLNDKLELLEVYNDERNTKETGGCHKYIPQKGCDI